MPNTINSPNMGLPVPVVGTDPGPQYATDVNTCLSLVDSHDHSAGKGVAITPAGLSISTDLPINSNNLTLVKTIRFQSQASPLAGSSPNLGCLYEVLNDLYYNDGVGNQIRITQSGSVSGSTGTITGLPSGTASAAYSAGTQTFIFQSATNTAANIDGRSIILRNSGASSPGLTLSAPTLGGNYTLTLPPIPGTKSIMALDTSGNISAPYTVDNSTIVISSNIIGVPAGGITTTQIASQAITPDLVALRPSGTSVVAGGVAVSNSCGTFSTGSFVPTFVDVTNLTVTITTLGSPIYIGLIGNATNISPSSYVVNLTSSESGYIKLLNGATTLSIYGFGGNIATTAPSMLCIDVQPAGTYTYKVQASCQLGDGTFINEYKLIAYEL